MSEAFSLGEREFKLQRLSVMKQLALHRKIFPVVLKIMPIITTLVRSGSLHQGKVKSADVLGNLAEFALLAEPFAEQLSEMKDADFEYVTNLAMSSVLYNSGQKFVPFWTSGGPMFHDFTDAALVLKLLVRVVMENLAPFINGLLTDQDQVQRPQTTHQHQPQAMPAQIG